MISFYKNLKNIFSKLYGAVEVVVAIKFGAVNLAEHDTLSPESSAYLQYMSCL